MMMEFTQKHIQEMIQAAVIQTATRMERTFLTRAEALSVAQQALPASIAHLDESAPGGDTLVLRDGSGMWGKVSIDAELVAQEVGVWEFDVKSISGANVTIRGGTIIHGRRAPILVPETNLAITQDGQIAYLTYALASGAATVRLANTFPFSGSGTVVRALQSFRLISGEEEEEAQATKLITYHRGTVCVDACYA